MSPATFIALLALSWALLLFLYLRKPRAVRRVVPFLKAWEELAPVTGSRRRQRTAPARSWALARALLLATLLALALFDPWSRWRADSGASTVVVLDAGAHMRATDESPNRFARARELAREYVTERVPGDEVMVAQLDRAFTPLSSFSRDPAALRKAIDAARVADDVTRFSAAVDFAMTALRGRTRPELVLVSDGAFDLPAAELARLSDAGIGLRQIALGQSGRNLAIRSFAVRALAWDAARAEAMIELENTGDEPQPIELTLLDGPTPIDVQRLTLDPRSRTLRFYLLTASGRAITARLAPVGAPPDSQPIDDAAYAVLAQLPPRRVLLVSEGQRYLENALRLDPRLAVDVVAPKAYRDARGYDLAIFDRFAPPVAPAAPSLWLAPAGAGAGAPYRVLGAIERPFFDEVERDAPLLRHVVLRDVNVGEAQRVALDRGDRILAASRQGPLIVAGTRADQPFVALTFDVRESDFVLRTGWPVFLANAIQQLTAAESEVEAPLLLARRETRLLPVAAARATLEPPSGERRTLIVRDGRVSLRLEEPGFHRVRVDGVDQLFAANPDPVATVAITPRRLAPAPVSPPGVRAQRPGPVAPWMLLAAAALLVFGFEFAFAAARGRRA